MDERKEILQDTIDRLIETALHELDQKLPEAGGSIGLCPASARVGGDPVTTE